MAVLVDFSGTLRSWHLRVLLVVFIGYSSSLLLFFTLDCRCSWSSQFLACHLYNDGQSVHPYIQRSFERKAPKPWSRQCSFCHVPFIFFKLRVQWVKDGPRKFIQDPLTSKGCTANIHTVDVKPVFKLIVYPIFQPGLSQVWQFTINKSDLTQANPGSLNHGWAGLNL